jgi:hypothetical protein
MSRVPQIYIFFDTGRETNKKYRIIKSTFSLYDYSCIAHFALYKMCNAKCAIKTHTTMKQSTPFLVSGQFPESLPESAHRERNDLQGRRKYSL